LAIILGNAVTANIKRPTPANLNLNSYNCLNFFTKFLIFALAWPNTKLAIANIIAIILGRSAIIAKRLLINTAV